jgi:hypothetical protein
MICSAAHPRYFNESASGRRHRPCSGFGFAIAVARSCPWCCKQAAAEHGDVPHVKCQNKLMTLYQVVSSINCWGEASLS